MGADTSDERAAAAPDVTVVVPVYNTMPYLTACLDSLVGQTIGAGRLHVVAVDDGSTDGSGAELERYAAEHPGLFTVVHQQNSGGPAAPCNRGLDLATGRFVFFLGADDYLDLRALEDLVDSADEWGSDVIFGRMVGVGGRGVSQRLFRATHPDVPFPHSALPFALANTKLFRRALLEQHGIRYGLDLRVGSDQPFTIEAMLHARRISVLGDSTFYYAVRRHDARNISFSSGWRARVEDIGTVMDHVADLVPPGDDRDAILRRHFVWELGNRLRRDLTELPEDDRRELCAAVGALADRYLTAGVSRRLGAAARLRLRLAQCGRVEELVRLADFERSECRPALALEGESAYRAFPGFGELPAEWFEVTAERIGPQVRGALRLDSLTWEGTTLVLTAETRLHPRSVGNVRVHLVPLRRGKRPRPFRRLPPGKAVAGRGSSVLLEEEAPGSRLTARLDLGPTPDEPGDRPHRWALRFHLDGPDATYDLPAEGDLGAGRSAGVRVGRRFFRLLARYDGAGRVVVSRRPVPLAEVLRERLRAAARRGRQSP